MRTLVAILALSPALLHAQAKLPAQPVSTPVLHASLTPPTSPLTAASPTALNPRVTTGVTPPRLIHFVNVEESTNIGHLFPFADRTVTLNLIVDATGTPGSIQIVKAADPFTDRQVLEAVSHFRYEPAMVSGMPVASPVNLQIIIKKN